MPNVVVVTTTKPDANEAEYGIRDTQTSQWIRHGIRIPVPVQDLPLADQAKLAAAREVMLRIATEHAQANGLV